MKNTTYLLAIICYIIAVAAFAEGIYKGIIINGLAVGGAMWWLGSSLRKEAKNYE